MGGLFILLMLYLKPLLPVLIVLLLVAVATLRKVEGARPPERSAALARLGLGLAKICLLALPLEWLVHLFQNGEPLAVSGKAVWLAAVAQTCQLYLVVTGTADVVTAISEWRGRAVVEMHHSAFRAGSFGGIWRRLMPGLLSGTKPHAMQCVPVLVLVAGAGALWHGGLSAVSVWFIIHYLLLSAEGLRGKPLFAPLPLPLQVILVLLVLVITNVLLVVPDLSAALDGWMLMFSDTKATTYSLLLDKRLTSGWLQTIVALSVAASVAAPRLGWVLEQPIKSWHFIGISLIPLSLLMPLREGLHAPVLLRQTTQWAVTWFFDQGNSRVHVGYDGWLFPRHELDRRTLKRRGDGMTEALLEMAADCKASGVPMMIVAVPAKMAMHPEQVFRAEYAAPVQPPGLKAQLEKLAAAGIEVVDPAQALWDRLIKAESHYAADSHWTFDTMKVVAGAVAKRVREKWPQVYVPETPIINASILDRTDPGDLALELLPLGGERFFGVESAQLVSIRGLESDAKSPIMIFGGEEMRVFEDADASFGNAEGKPQQAGFATQLAALLGRKLDVRGIESLGSIGKEAAGKKLGIVLISADDL
jgi:hypothetical protein